MGINFILPLIAGIVMTVILGTQVAPSLVENMKIAKVENRTIANQNLIKDAIVRYIKTNGVVPNAENGLADLENYGLMKAHHKDNLFSGGYRFDIDKAKGTLKIFTTINDNGAGKYFSNSFKFPNKPTCIELNGVCTGEFETFYLLDEETFNKIKPLVGSIEDTENKYSEANIGNKYDPDSLVGGEKDYVVNTETNEVKEYEYDKPTNSWNETNTIIDGIGGNGSNGTLGVWIKNIEVNGTMVEKVICNITASSYDKTILVINENTGLGELIWVAPNLRETIQTKIFGGIDAASLTRFDVAFNPNNICMSNVTNISYIFRDAKNFNSLINRWDTSNVTNMYGAFLRAISFNQDINNWDVSKVENMYAMFENANSFDKPLNNWDTSNVTTMQNMFYGSNDTPNSFNQNISNWNVSKVLSMKGMFRSANKFNQPIGNWDVRNVKDMDSMFNRATLFNQPIGNWDVRNVKDMDSMFNRATLFNQPIGNWDVSSVQSMDSMFNMAFSFNQPIGNWNVSNVKDMIGMFNKAYSFNQPIGNWNVSQVTNMKWLFSEATMFNQPLGNWNTSNVTDMFGMFQLNGFDQDIGNWKTGKVADMNAMFSSNVAFKRDISKWCVPLIPVKPTNGFNTNGWAEALKPQWGTCPNP